MSANPVIDQMAAEVRDNIATTPAATDYIEVAERMAGRLAQILPDMTRQQIGAVALLASADPAILFKNTAGEQDDHVCGHASLGFSILAMAGEHLYRTETSGS